MITYILALIPLSLVLYVPISNLLFGTSPSSTSHSLFLSFNESFIAPDDVDPALCPRQDFATHILSREPLVLYLEGFLGAAERRELLRVSETLYAPSSILSNTNNTLQTDPSIRRSDVATLPRTPMVKCIEFRARALQGWDSKIMLERIKIQRYGVGGHYVHHFDWVGGGGVKRVDRTSSFLVWVRADGGEEGEVEGSVEDGGVETEGGEGFGVGDGVEVGEGKERGKGKGSFRGGGTDFPRLRIEGRRAEICRQGWIECKDPKSNPSVNSDQSSNAKTETASKTDERGAMGPKQSDEGTDIEGVIFKPIPGNAIFWENLRKDSSGYDETWHAGLPVEEGTKVGLNIWSWHPF